MKKYLFPALALGLVMTSCQSDEPFVPDEGGEKQVTFTLNVPGELGTRAGNSGNNSGVGGWSNTQGNIQYTLVLDANGDKKILKNGDATTISGTTATFKPTVVLGRKYKITAYASLKDAWDGKNPIAITNSFNDESKDAYYKTLEHNFANGDLEPLTLTRPFGKLRLVAEDYDPAKTKVESVTITYHNPQHGEFNATTEAFTIVEENVVGTTKNFGYYEAADATGAHTIFAEYLPAPKENDYPVSFTVTVTYDSGTSAIEETYSRRFNDIPVRRNALTTLSGKFFTAGAEITVNVEDDFEKETIVDYTKLVDKWDETVEEVSEIEGVYTITKASQLAWIITSKQNFRNKVILLANDLDLDNIEWLSNNYSEVFCGTFDGQGHTIYNLKSTRDLGHGLFRRVYEGTVKNLNISQAYISNDNSVIGVICGDISMDSNIENCSVIDSEISGGSWVGGICGRNGVGAVSIKNCRVENTKITAKGGSWVGGICGNIGAAGSIIDGCFVSNSTISSYFTGAGGICGYSYGGKIINCNVENSLVIGEDDVDDIVGVNMGSISNCKSDDVTTYNKKLKECYVANAYGLDWISRNINSQRPNKNPMFDGSTIKFVDDIQSVSDNSVAGHISYQASIIQRGGVIDGCDKELMVLYRENDPRAEQFGIASYGGEIKNLTIKPNIPLACTIFRPILLYAPVEDVIDYEVEDVIIENVYLDSGSSAYGLSMPATGTVYDDIYLTVKTSTIIGNLDLGVFKSAFFENCKLESNITTHIDVKFKDCDLSPNLSSNYLEIWGGIVTFENCTYKGTLITKENVSTLFSIENHDGIAIEDCVKVM